MTKYVAYMTITETFLTVVEADSPQEAKAKLIDGKHGQPTAYAGELDGQWMPHKRRQITFEVKDIGGGDG